MNTSYSFLITALASIVFTAPSSGCKDCTNADLVVSALNLFAGELDGESAGKVEMLVVSVGDTLTAEGTEKNIGTEDARAHTFRFLPIFRSTSGTIELVEAAKDEQISRLLPNNEERRDIQFVMQQAGVYVMRGIADALERVCEKSESNNASTSGESTVGKTDFRGADLFGTEDILIVVEGDFDPDLPRSKYIQWID